MLSIPHEEWMQIRLAQETARMIADDQPEFAPMPLEIPEGAAKLAFYTDTTGGGILGSHFVDEDGRPIERRQSGH
jgi:hypothetical protein